MIKQFKAIKNSVQEGNYQKVFFGHSIIKLRFESLGQLINSLFNC